jgi:hypothetical protein
MPLGICGLDCDRVSKWQLLRVLFYIREEQMQRKDYPGKGRRRERTQSRASATSEQVHHSRSAQRALGDDDRALDGIFRSNSRHAQAICGEAYAHAMDSLRKLSYAYGLSVAAGELQLLDGKWYVTHAGLLGIATRSGCSAITTVIDRSLSDPSVSRWVFKATVYKSPRSRGFVGYGDADPSNTSPLVRGAEMRVAETRAVNRALRKAYGIGLCSVEELGSFSAPQRPSVATSNSNGHPKSNGTGNGQPRLRDQLCLLIRQHNLDPTLVKLYAADFCGTESLKDASRDRVESFVTELAASAKNDRGALICKLNSYAQPVEANP